MHSIGMNVSYQVLPKDRKQGPQDGKWIPKPLIRTYCIASGYTKPAAAAFRTVCITLLSNWGLPEISPVSCCCEGFDLKLVVCLLAGLEVTWNL